MGSGSRFSTALAALMSLVLATAVFAVDVRQPEGGATFHLDLERAYAPCTAPDTVALNGAPACTTVTSSECPFNGSFDIAPPAFDADPTLPLGTVHVNVNGNSAVCRTGGLGFALRIRTTASAPAGDGEDAACPSGECTFPDAVIDFDLSHFSFLFDANNYRDPSYEILDMSFAGPDGLPLAGFNVRATGRSITTNLTLPYPPCTAPGPGGACDLVPPSTLCDFESGTIEWPGLTGLGAPFAHVTMKDLAGASPACTVGPYTLEATLRVVGKVCGTIGDPSRCTVTDQTVSVPLPVQGRRIDAVVQLPLGPLGKYYETHIDNVGIVAARILDPLGEPIAVHGVTGVRSLVAPRVSIKGDRLRVRATIPVNQVAPTIDPTLEGGFTVTLKDRDGEFYAVTIPPVRWQDQTPIGSRWTYADPGAVLGGVRKASLKLNGKPGALKGYKLDLRAESVDLSGADVPSVTVSVAVARPDFIFGGDPQIHRAQRNCTGVFKNLKLECK